MATQRSCGLRDCVSSNASLFLGLLLGILSGGLIMATITALWLTSSNHDISSTTIAPRELRWMSTGVTIFNSTTFPYGIAFDSLGALYIADFSGNRIQKLAKGSSTSVVVAGSANRTPGNDSYRLRQPVHMTFDENDNMYVSDRENVRVQFFTKGNLSGTTVAGIAGTGGNTYNQLNHSTGVAYDTKTRCLFVADTYNKRVMKYERNTGNGIIFAGGNDTGTSSSRLTAPFGLHFDALSNSLLITDYTVNRVIRWAQGASNWTLVAGSSTGTSGINSTLLYRPLGLTLDPMGNLYVADMMNHRIQFFRAGSSVGQTIAGMVSINGTNSTLLNRPYWVALDSQLNLYVTDSSNDRIQMFKRS